MSGSLTTDSGTVPSFFRMIDEDMDYVVHNLGGVWEWMGWKMRTQVYREGDVVIIFSFDAKPYEQHGINLVDISQAYYRLKSDLAKCVWESVYRCNARVNKNIAELLYIEMEKKAG